MKHVLRHALPAVSCFSLASHANLHADTRTPRSPLLAVGTMCRNATGAKERSQTTGRWTNGNSWATASWRSRKSRATPRMAARCRRLRQTKRKTRGGYRGRRKTLCGTPPQPTTSAPSSASTLSCQSLQIRRRNHGREAATSLWYLAFQSIEVHRKQAVHQLGE
jgi:hypothetical protein